MRELRKSLFGMVAVVGDFITEAQLDGCLEKQSKVQADTGVWFRLGVILQQQGLVTEEGIEEIMEIQRRLSNGFFGETAIRLKFASVDQVEEALMYQERQRSEGEDPGRIGDILIEYEVLTREQRDTILEKQEEFTRVCQDCGLRRIIWGTDPDQPTACTNCGALLPTGSGRHTLEPEEEPGQAEENEEISLEELPPPPVPAEAENDEPPALVPGYTVIEFIGHSPDGIIYKAVQDSTEWEVMLEVLTNVTSEDSDFMRRLHEEAQKAMTLRHPAVISVFSVGEHGGRPFAVTEYVEAQSLHGLLKETDALPRLGATQIALKITAGLKAAAEAGLVHGDLKPSLILIQKDGEVKLARLGVAKRFDPNLASGSNDEAEPMISPYTAPEVLLGRVAPDMLSDIYSLGAVYFHMVTGKVPYSGDTAREILLSVGEGPRQALAETTLPGYVCGPLEEMLAPDRSKRPSDYDAVLMYLNAITGRLSGMH
ncbi:serine/threonine-protein kinase [Planctomycetota bacterium]